MALSFTPGQQKFVGALAHATGLGPKVVGSWVYAEQNGSAARGYEQRGYHNWLNVANTDSGPASGAHSSVWRNPVTAARATAEWLKGEGQIAHEYGKPAAGIMAILHTAGRDPMQQIQAIASSPWASSHYNGGSTLRSLYGQIGGQQFPAETSPGTVQGQEPSSGQPMAAAGGSDVLAGLLAAVRTQAAQPQPMQLGSPARPAASAGPILPGGSHAPAAFSPAQPSQDQSLVKLIEAAQASAGSSSPEATAGGAEAGGGGGGGSAGYVNPLPGFTKGRTDQGVDYSARPGAPIKALGNGRVLKTSPNWYAGQPYVSYELTDGPRKGQVIYVAEQIVPHVSEGQHVRAGQTIGVYAPTGTGVETGLGTRTPGVVKTPYNGRADGSETSGGIEARKLLESLGAR